MSVVPSKWELRRSRSSSAPCSSAWWIRTGVMRWRTTDGTSGTTSMRVPWWVPTTSPAAASSPPPSSRLCEIPILPSSPVHPNGAPTSRCTGCSTAITRCGVGGRYGRSMRCTPPGGCSKNVIMCTRWLTPTSGSSAAIPTACPSRWPSITRIAASCPSSLTAQRGCRPSALWDWLRTEHLPALLPGSDADLVAAFTPISPDVDGPGDAAGEGTSHRRTLLLWFLSTPPEVAWETVIVEHRRRLEESGLGTVVAALPFIPTIPGTDTYTDKLWVD